jgi:hypothetical protein
MNGAILRGTDLRQESFRDPSPSREARLQGTCLIISDVPGEESSFRAMGSITQDHALDGGFSLDNVVRARLSTRSRHVAH